MSETVPKALAVVAVLLSVGLFGYAFLVSQNYFYWLAYTLVAVVAYVVWRFVSE